MHITIPVRAWIHDSLGVLLLVEPPTWGFGKQTYSKVHWTRLNECARQMVTQAFNHPSIFLWGLFNEPGRQGGRPREA